MTNQNSVINNAYDAIFELQVESRMAAELFEAKRAVRYDEETVVKEITRISLSMLDEAFVMVESNQAGYSLVVEACNMLSQAIMMLGFAYHEATVDEYAPTLLAVSTKLGEAVEYLTIFNQQ